MDKIVGIGEFAVTGNIEDKIRTFALASCIAITVYCPFKKAAGMIHVALPFPTDTSNLYLDKKTCYYAVTGIPFLLNKMYLEFGCLKHELIIEIYGGASSIRENDIFNIGEKNIKAVKNTLDNLNVRYTANQIGGKHSRTLIMYVSTGKIEVILQPITI